MMGIINTVITGDCLFESDKIASGSIDLILTDLPYGTVKNIGDSESINHGMKGKTEWDDAINPKDIYAIANRILRKNGKMVLFSQEPYSSRLINESIPNIPFSYRMIWEKDHFANSLIAKKAPVSYFEDVLVFSKKYDNEEIHPLRPYFKKVMEFIGLNLKQINAKLGHRKAEHSFYISSTQFGLCTEKTYNELIETFAIDAMDGFRVYEDIANESDGFSSTFNLWEGGKYKSNILRYKKDYNGYHPTQKPILLLEDLIRTFSNEGDTVVDLTAGSGSTAVAAINTKRNFIAIEQDAKYADIARQRISDAMKTEVDG